MDSTIITSGSFRSGMQRKRFPAPPAPVDRTPQHPAPVRDQSVCFIGRGARDRSRTGKAKRAGGFYVPP